MMGQVGNEMGKGRLWSGWILSGLIAAFNVLDAAVKFTTAPQVVAAFERTGWPMRLAPTLAVILLACTLLYLIPRTATLGAILTTAYFGGAVATNLRLQNPLFTNTLFPVYFGILLWVGLWLRDRRVGSVFPFMS